ncbi:hypothetical protein EMIHUDRAFT_439421 [Emiliania huxleyi CCMP1516]|uniref:THIF-type NAD/FAD binding fold domain-containing protein n=4 Tax=Emiliania huxleyi TaxID=2903 RepID=A0A0D3KZ08_EMIH1|nr:hypothetical protein EMIHUDRAFT_439421 [Emiliania huxleyi CCMP1516]EOD40993.1 hypothetical protein EMIHUDRAFT_439421 [Emiliania huxleyi CCMP1516]|eukprot:XP_005793422.1 hypothetical protein EMIHUDRAFT_439421 [Emiliania huxleyi CCMP1516]
MAAPAPAPTSDIDTKRYDRQIRLWGLETQRGLQGTRLLLLRATGLCNEIAKNLVLAGIGHVSIADPDAVSQADLEHGGVFSLSKDNLGSNKAEAMASRLKELNPSVEVEGIPKPLEQLTDQELRSFHIVVGTHGLQGVDDLAAATDRLCGAGGEPAAAPNGNGNGKKRLRDEAPEAKGNGSHEIVPTRSGAMPQLLAAGTLGLFGFCALDLMAHTHRVVKKAKKEDEEPPPPEHFVVRYPALRDAFRVGWRSLDRRTPRLYAALQLLLRGGGQEEVEARRAERLEEDGLKETFLREPLTAEYVATVVRHAATELSPMCAIVGGTVAAEVIKLVEIAAGKGQVAPINNVLLFDNSDGAQAAGITGRFGPAFRTDDGGVDKGTPQPVAA